MSTSRRENSLYKHKYRELLKVIDSIKMEIRETLREPYYQHIGEDWRNGLMLAENIINQYIGEEE